MLPSEEKAPLLQGNGEVRRANGETWQLGYDGEGNLTRMRKVGDAVGWEYQYDGLGRVIRVTNGRGQVSEFRYDSWGRVREKRTPEKVVQYSYDKEGRLLQMSETATGGASRATVWTYQDTTGWLQKVTSPEGEVEYSWHEGQLVGLKVTPNGASVREWQYAYKAVDELEDVSNLIKGLTKKTGIAPQRANRADQHWR